MATLHGFEIIDQTAFRISEIVPRYSIFRADYGEGYADTANGGVPGGQKSFTAVAGLWSDDTYYGTIEGQAWMAYYYDFLNARLENGNEPFVIFWREKYWLVELAEPELPLQALKSFNSDMFVPASMKLIQRRTSAVPTNADGSIEEPEP